MPLQFHRADEKMEIWSANSDGYSFVISYESPAGPGFHGQASWRPVYEGRGAVRITGSPFKAFDEAEAACDATLKHLLSEICRDGQQVSSGPEGTRVNTQAAITVETVGGPPR